MTTADEADKKARLERAREAGLFRYSLVQELLEPGLSQAERGWRARELAGRVHEGPGGRRVTVSYSTLTRWRRRYEEGGFDALVPSPRQPAPRTPEEVLALAEALKREKPGRTAAQVRRILQVTTGWAPSDRTLQRLFERLELDGPPPGPEEEQRALRPVRVHAAERDVDRGHAPRPGDRREEVVSFRVHRRPLPRRDGGPLGASRRRGPDGRGVPPGPAGPRRPESRLPGQRQRVRRRVAAARLRRPGHKAHPLPSREARGERENRALFPDCPGSVPRRGRRRGRRSRTWRR